MVGILVNNSRLGDVNNRFNDLNNRISDLHGRINDLRAHMDTRFDEMRDTWRAELRRVEEVLDARLKQIEGQ